MEGQQKRKPAYVAGARRRSPVKDSRTKFDKWLDSNVNGSNGPWIELTLSIPIIPDAHSHLPGTGRRLFCRILEVDRYWIEVFIRTGKDRMSRYWLAKENILAARIVESEMFDPLLP